MASACLVVGLAVGTVVALAEVAAHDFAGQGLTHLALRTLRHEINRWLSTALFAGALLAGFRWLVARFASRLDRTRRMRDLVRAFGIVALPLFGMEFFLYGILGADRINPDLFPVHLGASLLIVLVAVAIAVVFVRPLRRRWARFAERISGRPNPGDLAFRRVFFVSAAPFFAFDAFLLLVYHVRISFFISPVQLMPHDILVVKLVFDAVLVFSVIAAHAGWLRGPLARGPRRLLGAAGIAAVLAAAGANLAGALQRPPAGVPDVLIVVIDALRADRLGVYGYGGSTSPNLDALARRGVVFRNAYSNASSTKLAIPSLFTSLYPNVHGVTGEASVLSKRALTLAELLSNAGWSTWYYNGGNIYLHERFQFGQGFEKSYFQYPAPAVRVTDAFLRDLDRIGEGPFFAYLHYMDVHTPYNENVHSLAAWDRSLRVLAPGGGSLANPNALDLDERGRAGLSDLYDAQIRYADEQIGRALAGLRDAGRLEETVVVVTADHGEEFWEHERFGHAQTLFEEVLRIPLIVAGPEIGTAEVATRVRIVDVLPTILELAGVAHAGPEIQGEPLPLAATGSAGPDRPVFAMTSISGQARLALLEGSRKVITGALSLAGLTSKRVEPKHLYDLVADPAEQKNLVGEPGSRGEAARLEEQLTGYARMSRHLPTSTAEIDPEMRGQLEELGYMRDAQLSEGAGSVRSDSGEGGPIDGVWAVDLSGREGILELRGGVVYAVCHQKGRKMGSFELDGTALTMSVRLGRDLQDLSGTIAATGGADLSAIGSGFELRLARGGAVLPFRLYRGDCSERRGG